MRNLRKPLFAEAISQEEDIRINNPAWMRWFQEIGDGKFNQLTLKALDSDPNAPGANKSVIWQSDGTDSGDDGDIMIKITDSGGNTKTTTLVDYSGV